MPQALKSEPAPATPAAEATPAPVAPSTVDPTVTKDGVPLTAGASLEDLLHADPLPAKAEAPLTVPEAAGSELSETPVETPEVPVETPTEEPESADVDADAASDAPVDEAALIDRLTSEHRGLLRLKGEQARQVGDLRQQVAQRDAELAALRAAPSALPAMSAEELTAKLLEDPAGTIAMLVDPLVQDRARKTVEALLTQRTNEWQAQAAEEQQAVAPEVAKDLFRARHGIAQDFDTWLTSDDGKAVNEIVFKDPMRRRALEGYRDDGDVVGIADILSNALDLRRTGQKAAKARHSVNGERQRIEAGKPLTAPRAPATPPATLPRAKSLLEPWSEADLKNFLSGASAYERED